MKLYFYELNMDGISVTEMEAVEKPKTYYPADKKSFPNYACFVRKEDEGRIISGFYKNIFLTKPNFDFVKEKFREDAEKELESAREKFEMAENRLKIIVESEEKENGKM